MKTTLNHVNLEDFPRLKQTEYLSPFRYPGGKAFLTGYLADVVSKMPTEDGAIYAEPYCGGAGAALALLGQDRVEKVLLNDRDPRIFSAWSAILNENERFLSAVRETPVTIKTWKKCRELVAGEASGYSFEVGFATYFLNRTSRSGIIIGSGPIGGYEQRGEWKVDARYYKETMLRRLKWIGDNAQKVQLSNEDGLVFLDQCADMLDGQRVLYFVDPPYVKVGSRLYLNGMSEDSHAELAEKLKSSRFPHWVLTYDNHPLIRELYSDREMSFLSVNYSLRNNRKENELLVR